MIGCLLLDPLSTTMIVTVKFYVSIDVINFKQFSSANDWIMIRFYLLKIFYLIRLPISIYSLLPCSFPDFVEQLMPHDFCATYAIGSSYFTGPLTPTERLSVRQPIFSPDGSKLVYLECTAGGPHSKCMKLKMVNSCSIA